MANGKVISFMGMSIGNIITLIVIVGGFIVQANMFKQQVEDELNYFSTRITELEEQQAELVALRIEVGVLKSEVMHMSESLDRISDAMGVTR